MEVKNELAPKEMDPPLAKKDNQGNLITAPNALTNLYRLKHRQIKPEFYGNYLKKIELWEMRFNYLKIKITDDWSHLELTQTLKSLKNNKSRDPRGLINKIFKPPVIGGTS